MKELSKFFVTNSKTNLNTHCRSNWYQKPTVIYYGSLNKSLTELLELKACKLTVTIKVKRVSVCGMTDVGINNLIIKARAKGEWLVIESL